MKRRLVIAAAAIVALLVSFSAGRFSRPAKVVQTTKTETVTQWRDRVEIQKVETQAAASSSEAVTKWRTVYKPGGIVIRTVSVERQHQSAERDSVASAGTTESSSSKSASTTSSKTVLAPSPPKWSVSAIGIVDAADALHLRVSPSLGVVVSRRIFGPLELGAFGSTRGEAGIVVGARF